jgi:hypothetical protein
MSSGPASRTATGQAAHERESRRAWPQAAQFNEAVQNLATSLVDRELQAGQPELGPLGLPMPYAGNFADVYKVHCPATGNTWAVKFFKREVRDLQQRYRAISEHLAASQLPFMVDFHYQEEGVRIGRERFPLVKMRWVEGLALNRFVAQSLAQPKMLDQLFALWVKLAARLRSAGVAHADLQHGNVVLVQGDQGRLLLKLIDYDGMFVPALAGQQSGELGHANFQHPQRDATRAYHAELDRFSHLAICTALRCLRAGGVPLWERFNNEENLLFTARDFRDPASSALFRELWTLRNPDARALVGQLALATQRPLEQTPLLDELVRDGQVRPLTDQERHHVEGFLRGEVIQEAPAAVPLLIPLLRPTTNEPLVACPRCYGQVSMPAQASPEMQVRCPLCGGEYQLSEAFYLPASAWAAAANPIPPPSILNPLDLPLLPPPEPQPPPTTAVRHLQRISAPLLWVDRRLDRLAGDGNKVFHNFLRVVAAVVLLVVVPWLLGRAAASVPSLFDTKASQLARVERARNDAYAALSAALSAPPQWRNNQLIGQGQQLLSEAGFALTQQRFAESRQLFDQATDKFRSALPPAGTPNPAELPAKFQTAIAQNDLTAAADYLAQMERLRDRAPGWPLDAWRRQLESMQRRQAGTKGGLVMTPGGGTNNVYAGSTRPGFPKLPEGAGPMDANPQASFNVTASGMKYRMLRKGNGKPARAGQLVKYHALAWLDDGSVIANHNTYSPNRPTNMILGPGNFAPLVEGLQLVRAGGMIELEIPASAYANSFPGPGVPPGATMHFVVELLEVFN